MASEQKRTPPAEPLRLHGREDNYPEYVRDTWGYRYEAWEICPPDEIKRHDDLLHGGQTFAAGAQDAANQSNLLDCKNDLLLWAAAQASLHQDGSSLEIFHNLVARILSGNRDHPAIEYPEIALFAAEIYVEHGRFQQAIEIMSEWKNERHELTFLASVVNGIAQILSQPRSDDEITGDSIATLFHGLHSDEYQDAERLLDAAEKFNQFGLVTHAAYWVERARQVAELTGDKATVVDIELFEHRVRATAE